MTLTADYQIEPNGSGTVLGQGTVYRILSSSGFGRSGNQGSVTARTMAHGSSFGSLFLAAKPMIFNVALRETSASSMGSALRTLVAAWAPPTTGAEQYLDLRYPGFGETTLRMYGVFEDIGDQLGADIAVSKVARLTCTFLATDPLMYGAAATTTTNAGNAYTDRATVTVTGTGGTPEIINTNDSNGWILWATTLAVGATRIIDMRAKTVVDGSGNDKRGELSNASNWFRFRPTTNTLSVTDCSVSTVLRPAWY